MKKLILILSMLVTAPVMADGIRVGIMAHSYQGVDESVVNLEKNQPGVIVSADYGILGVDLYARKHTPAANLRFNLFDTNGYTLSAGVGIQTYKATFSDYTDNWDTNGIPDKTGRNNFKFIEVAHKSGVFARVSRSNVNLDTTFVRSHVEIIGGEPVRVVDNTKSVSFSDDVTQVSIGYRHTF